MAQPNTATANRSERIAEIVAKRQPLAQRIISVESNLTALGNVIKVLETNRQQQLEQWANDPKIVANLEKVNFATILETIKKELQDLSKLRVRFARETLNIGVVGRMRQGKSTLLQTLSGLSNDEIPARSGKACTAVRSTIYHRPENLTEALVTFHTEESFLQEVILPYFNFKELSNILPKTHPRSLDHFKKMQLPLPDMVKGDEATVNTIYKRLYNDYYLNCNDYSPFIGKQPIRITKEKIREYVAQEEKNGKLTDSKHLAVQKVEIYCPFPNADEVGKIALVDIPGLGDFKLGDETLMLKTLGEEVDVVLFIRKPDEDGWGWETNDTMLYDTASQALNELPARSFVVLNNKVNEGSGNLQGCKDLKSDIDYQRVKINVVECLIANCRDSQQANQVLDQVLDYLETQVIELDARYAKSNQECLIQLHEQLKIELDKAKTALGGTGLKFYNFIAQEFNKLFGNDKKGWWSDVTFGLETLRSHLWLYRDEPDTNLEEQVIEAIQNCNKNKGILSDENAIEKIDKQIKISSALRTYADYQDQLRVLLSHHFIALDDGLKKLIEGTKNQVAEVLIEEGRLGALTDARGSEFIRELEKLIDLADGDQNRFPHLKQGLRIFIDFELSYRGLVQHRIRKHLDELTNVLASNNSIGQSLDRSDEILPVVPSTTAEEILTALEIKYDKAVHRIQPALEELLWEPSQAAYAMVEEFVDNVIRQEDVQEEWKNFLMEVRSQIWPEQLGQLENNQELRDHWLQLVKNVETTNQPQLFQFLNV